jgi:hypothetical protein
MNSVGERNNGEGEEEEEEKERHEALTKSREIKKVGGTKSRQTQGMVHRVGDLPGDPQKQCGNQVQAKARTS